MKHKEIELIEKKYLDEISWYLTNEKDKIINLLQTKDTIKLDWEEKFNQKDKKKQSSEIARGSERIFGAFFPNTWKPNSAPIGSDFMYETYDSIIHIDIKTVQLKNTADHKGKVPIGENQTSYFSVNCEFYGNLPSEYTINRNGNKKLCVTLIIQIISEENDVVCVVIISVPNYKLHELYGDDIVDAGKSKGKSIRYKYGDQIFKTLDSPRFNVVYSKNEDMKKKVTDLAL